MSDPLWINADAGSPEYNAAELRRALATLIVGGVADAQGARQGIRPGHVPASLSGTTWTVHDLCAVVYPGLTSTSGPYLVGHGEESGSLDPADGTNDRIDGLDLQVQDDDEDASGQRRARVVYTAGTPGASPSAPAQAANSVRVATVSVPQDGTGSPTLTVVAPWTVAAGGILPVRDTSELPASGMYEGMRAWDQGTRQDLVREGGGWSNVRHEEVFADASVTSHVNLSNSEVTIITATLDIPSWWNTWRVRSVASCGVHDNGAAAGQVLTMRIRHGGVGGTVISAVPQERATTSPDRKTVMIPGSATGRTGTGSQVIRFTGQLQANDNFIAPHRHIWAVATRES